MDARGVESESESPGVRVLVRSQNLSFEEDSDSCPEFSNPGVGVKSPTKKQGLRIPDGCTDRETNREMHHSITYASYTFDRRGHKICR